MNEDWHDSISQRALACTMWPQAGPKQGSQRAISMPPDGNRHSKSTPYSPYHKHIKSEPVVPNEINEYNVSLGHLSNAFQRGHRIKLEVESLESPQRSGDANSLSSSSLQQQDHPPQDLPKQNQSHLVLPIVNEAVHYRSVE